MREMTRKGFEEAFARDGVQRRKEEEAAREAETAETNFRRDFSRRHREIVVPAIDEIRSMLEEKGWGTRLEENAERLHLKCEIWRGNMMGVGSHERPFIAITGDPRSQTVAVSWASMKERDDSTVIRVHELSREAIEDWMLALFQRLVGQR